MNGKPGFLRVWNSIISRTSLARGCAVISRATCIGLLLSGSSLAVAQNPTISGVITQGGLSSYSVSYNCPATACYLEENGQFVGDWVEGPGSGFLSAQNKPQGTYSYQLFGVYYPSGSTSLLGAASITVPVVNYPQPVITLTTLSAVGPINNPYYYNFGWTAGFTNENGCRLETADLVMVDGYSTVLPGYVWNYQPATATVQIYPRHSQTLFVYYELRCTGPGGTAQANGALQF